MTARSYRQLVLALLLLLLCSRCGVEQPSPRLDPAQRKAGSFRIAFGSCAKQDRPQAIWKAVVETKPDAWVWLGDAIYADRQEDVASMSKHYGLQKANAEYQLVLKNVPVILGTWDDNDYGSKRKGKAFEKKSESERLYLDFLGEPLDSPRRKQEGIYWSYLLGANERQVRVILLDVQYHCDPPGPDGDVLGEQQWAWLEKELRETRAAVNIIFSGMQIIAAEQPFDKWANYPSSRQRLLKLIKDSKAPGVILGSGDRHLGELSRMETSETAYPLYDLTSSGLTHHVDSVWHVRNFFSPEKNRYRLGQLFTQKNFGIIDVDWGAGLTWIILQVRDEEGRIRIEERIDLSKLRPVLSSGVPSSLLLDRRLETVNPSSSLD